jgi:hypothetical protein
MDATHSGKTGSVEEGPNQSGRNVEVNRGAVSEGAEVHDMAGVATNIAHGGITNIDDVARPRIDRDDAGFAEKD